MAKRDAAADKEKAIESAISQIEKQWGQGSIMRLGGEKSKRVPTEVIPTGSLALDVALGAGGVPRGRIVEIFGPEGSGKTTVILHIIAEAQKRGGVAAFVDAEHALNVDMAEKLGVDFENVLIAQPSTGEEALEITDTLVRSGAFDIVALDSVAALVPRAELEGDMGDSHMGLHARLMSQALRKLTGSISRSKTCVIFANQIRMKIGVMFGNPETTTGGRALPFYASVRLDIRRIGSIKDGQEVVGNRVKVRVVKNKMAPPFKECEFDLMFGLGISREGSLLDMAELHGLVQKSGTWFSYGDERLGQGRENVKRFFMENPHVAAKLEGEVREAVGLSVDDMVAVPEVKKADAAEAKEAVLEEENA